MKRARPILLSLATVAAAALFLGCSDQSMPTSASSSAVSETMRTNQTMPDPMVAAAAQTKGVFDYWIGEGVPCSSKPGDCADISEAVNGDEFVFSGKGTVSMSPPMITGGGIWEKRDAGGKVLAKGTWTASKLDNFVSYGPVAKSARSEPLYGGQMQAVANLASPTGEFVFVVTYAEGRRVPASAMTGATVKYAGEAFTKPIQGANAFALSPLDLSAKP